ncbi:MAG: GSCFA family protein [Rhodobacteraceae bacterium]|nr:MAG: GSCFA family protein [Paracoccaceae bacterium]
MPNPYSELDQKFFWASAVAQHSPLEIEGLWQPKKLIEPKHKTITFGSCFAQHIGTALTDQNFHWLDTEPAPIGLNNKFANDYNYGVFSCRTGNIYTVTLLKQWLEWALGVSEPPNEIWSAQGRYFDPFRPSIEPNGFLNEQEVTQSRQITIDAFMDAIETADVFIFTLGLTESWFNHEDGYEYPMCPGTAAGKFNPDKHDFVNQDYTMILSALTDVLQMLRKVNSNIHVLLTVSPVPLIATNSGNHVLVATMQSKSILRAVAAAATQEYSFVDYFPSYEIINSPAYQGMFFADNKRTVTPQGVSHVMDHFFKGLQCLEGEQATEETASKTSSDITCEEELLDAFRPK